MAFDMDNQVFGTLGGSLLIETGTKSFSGTGTSITLNTRLTKIYNATISANGTLADGVEQYACTRTVSAGTVTITRIIQEDSGDNAGTPAVVSGMEVSYILIGV